MKPLRSSLFFVAGLAAVAVFYACGSSSNGNSGGTPPQNEAGPDQTSSSSSGGSSGGSSGSMTSDGSEDTGDAGPPACGDLPGVVYVMADQTQESLLKVLGRQLRDDASISIAFELAPSCAIASALFAGTTIPGGTNLLYIPSSAEAPGWKPSDPELQCIGAPVKGPVPDLGIAALNPSSCPNAPFPPADIGVLNGPVQPYAFVVPGAEFVSQKAISAAEAYYAFGDGANNPVTYFGMPEWNDPTQFFLRPATEASLVASALDVGLTPPEMTLAGADGGPSADGRHLLAASSDVLTAVTSATSTKSIGLVETATYDHGRSQAVDALAFAAFGQTYAFYPDLAPTSFDKQNVRDGHYANWSSTLYITLVDNSGVPTKPGVKYMTDLVFGVPGASPPGGYAEGGVPIDGIADVASAGLVPNCAMQVQKSAEGQPLSPYAPQYPCTCSFLNAIGAQLPATCTKCMSSSDCGDGALGCLNGFCETPPTPPTTGQPGCTVSDGTNDGILNACTNAQYVQKTSVVLPEADGGDGGLEPVNP